MTIDLYPEIIRQEDLSPDSGFGGDIDEDCQVIHDATKGWGANAQKVIDSLATKDASDRYMLSKRYEELFENKLVDIMKKEFRGDFGLAMEFLAMPLHEAECYMIKKATEGIGASIKILYSVMIGRTNEELNLLKKTFFQLYTKDLGQLMAKELHGDMERLIFNCMQAGEEGFDPQYHTEAKAKEDAQTIHEKGLGKWFGTDEKSIFKILCAAPPEYFQMINLAYADKFGYTLMKAMEKELSGNVRDGTLFMIGMKLKPYETIAKLVETACAGIGTNELLLTCCIIRYQMVMKDVMAAHIELYGSSIHERVRSEVGGKFKKMLLESLNAVWPEEG